MPHKENPNFLDKSVRVDILKGINTEENYSRKREAQRRFDVYRGRQDRYIIEKLLAEFKLQTVREMRKVLSINMTERIINELSSIYKNAPDREYSEASDREQEQLENLNETSKKNARMKLANKYFNLWDDVDILVLPRDERIMIKPLTKMGYDIVEDVNDPEKAYGLILSTFDDSTHASYRNDQNITKERADYYNQDFQDQKIADNDDRRKLLQRYIWWSPEVHFTTDGFGEFTDEPVDNPIGRLPLVNISREKDNQYFTRRGSSITDFALEFSVSISDIGNNIKMQGYAQAVITSTKQPANLQVGANTVIWLEQDPNASVQPKFEFVSPTPDIANSLEYLATLLRLFLSSRGMDPKAISGQLQGQTFSSGVERLLAMIDRFDASQDDIDLFRCAEIEVLDLEREWSNIMQGVNDETRLLNELNVSRLNDDIKLSIKFNGPEAIKTEKEELEIVERRMENGTMSIIGAIERLDEVDKDRAKEILEEIRAEEEESGETDKGSDENSNGGQPEVENELERDLRDRLDRERKSKASDGRNPDGKDN